MSENQKKGSARIDYVDVAKGILICLMLYGHIRVYGPMEGLKDDVMRLMGHTGGVYSAFFMQSFFILTGFCASFKIPFGRFLWKNVKTLLLPGFALLLFSEYYKEIVFRGICTFAPIGTFLNYFVTGGHWFILAMFWAKVVYWPIAHVRLSYQLLLVCGVYFVGLLLNTLGVTNYQWHQHAFLMVPYLCVGVWWRDHQELVDRWIKPVGVCGIVLIVVQHVLSQCRFFSLPSHDHAICISFRNFPLHVFNSVVGTAFVVYLAKKIRANRFLSVMGGGTLLVYTWNGLVYRSIVRLLPYDFVRESFVCCVVFHVAALGFCYLAFYFLIPAIYKHRLCNWIVGKW